MPLQQLVEYFNDRLELQHNVGYRPFVLNQDKVEGLFGPIRIGTHLVPISDCQQNTIIGYAAQLKLQNNQHSPQNHELDTLINFSQANTANTESIINFDRLSRSVHMLNYLPEAHLEQILFLDVDPRHIIGVKTDHGAYFEEVIRQCGLNTSNVAISLSVTGIYARFYQSLLKGLANYQSRGYRIALKFDYQDLDKSSYELIIRAGADFVGLCADDFERIRPELLHEKIGQLKNTIDAINARSLLFNLKDQTAAKLCQNYAFNLWQGEQPKSTAIAA